MAEAGIVGLALWPEDLRHPVALEPCVDPIMTPEQFAGLTVRAAPSAITADMFDALKATSVWPTDLVARVATCEIQAAESGLRQLDNLAGSPTLTADVTFFPKYQVLAVHGQTFSDLSKERQAIIRDAAIAVRDEALADHQSDAQAAVAWCAGGGRVVLAGQDAIARFQRAARPVYERLTSDPEVERVVAEIRALKDTVTPSTPVVACESSRADAPPVDAPAAHASTITPEGNWRTTVTVDDIRAAHAHPSNGGTITLTFDDGAFRMSWAADSPGGAGSCDGSYEVVGDAVRMTFTSPPCDQYWIDVVWSETGDALMGQVVAWEFGPHPHPNDIAIIASHPWTRID
jgi:hypothetical protein